MHDICNAHNENNGKKAVSARFLFELFITFFKIGSFTLGGGYAMLPLIEREVVHNKGWIDANEIVDYLAVCQSIPGAIAINTATFIGKKTAGKKGAIFASLGVILPSFLVITITAAFFSSIKDYPLVKAAFLGMHASSAALIAMAAIRIARSCIRDSFGLAIAIIAIIAVVFLKIHAIFTIIAGAAAGLVVYLFFPGKAGKILSGTSNVTNNENNNE
ncbi:MAG: chromate transporter [Clostridiaceae bacterium]|nr:chromate transporter [Clostridiaceae bacterium]